jgi:hypothetical protein
VRNGKYPKRPYCWSPMDKMSEAGSDWTRPSTMCGYPMCFSTALESESIPRLRVFPIRVAGLKIRLRGEGQNGGRTTPTIPLPEAKPFHFRGTAAPSFASFRFPAAARPAVTLLQEAEEPAAGSPAMDRIRRHERPERFLPQRAEERPSW